MKLVVQIPCLNEQSTLPLVLNSIPKHIQGIDEIQVLVIDDGSTDKTVDIAKSHGVKHFVHHNRNQGLGRSFHDGTQKALELGADIIVNTDGDNQYPQNRIGDIVQPILNGEADIVIADRQTHTIEHFSFTKKLLQRLGSKVVNKAAGTQIPDAASGFRAYSRDSIIRLNTITRFSYCTETIIQAGNKGLHISSIPVETNEQLRESRLFKSTSQHVRKSAITIIRAYIMYKPYILFGGLGVLLFVIGLIPFARYFFFSIEDGTFRGHIQSLLIGAVIMIVAFMCFVLNVIADLIRINRILIEDNLEQAKRLRFDKVSIKN
ncbi:MAG TPA: DPM/DPG synthase family glycosyltransferase [Candidatus Saccharimonadales bacterium]|nr:DPM/DPG synthase family glycosyltransferase [Candidatus Saccharimonadales bacterium]